MLNDPKLVLQSISCFVNAPEILERQNRELLEAWERKQSDYPLVQLDISLASPELQAMLKTEAAQVTNETLPDGVIVVGSSWLEAIESLVDYYANCMSGNHDYEGRWCNDCGNPNPEHSANAHTEYECSHCHKPLATMPDGAPEICNCDGQYDI